MDSGSGQDVFRLRPYEDVLGGVRLRGTALQLRSSIGARAMVVWDLLGSALFAGVAVGTGNPLWAILALPNLVLALRWIRCNVTACGSEISVTNRWRTYRIDVRDVSTLRIEHGPSLGPYPFYGLFMPEVVVGTLHLGDGTRIPCDALTGLPRDDRVLEPTPVQAKVAILHRWLKAAGSLRAPADDSSA